MFNGDKLHFGSDGQWKSSVESDKLSFQYTTDKLYPFSGYSEKFSIGLMGTLKKMEQI